VHVGAVHVVGVGLVDLLLSPMNQGAFCH